LSDDPPTENQPAEPSENILAEPTQNPPDPAEEETEVSVTLDESVEEESIESDA
jgi:hypothetical protein